MNLEARGLEFDAATQEARGFAEFTDLLHHHGQVIQGRGVLRGEAHRFAEGRGRAVEVALRLEQRAVVDAQGGVIGMSRDGRLIMRERFSAQAGVVQREPELQVAHREVRPEREGRAVTGDCREVFALTEQGVAQVVTRRRAAGAACHSFGQQLLGACMVAVVDEA